ncbi:UNKNOWN [Stylonychia lemnae]|uniref:Uncharacterized protein n=1 Tax=Stylonychia lemnae TaxID=5949 RepID=A0A078APN8_STYLE|nr:UNKNOWN [Stylonychia lemnae]|eukprot:CDW84124.1 UNKNOWN [Stylonychia lemnae]
MPRKLRFMITQRIQPCLMQKIMQNLLLKTILAFQDFTKRIMMRNKATSLPAKQMFFTKNLILKREKQQIDQKIANQNQMRMNTNKGQILIRNNTKMIQNHNKNKQKQKDREKREKQQKAEKDDYEKHQTQLQLDAELENINQMIELMKKKKQQLLLTQQVVTFQNNEVQNQSHTQYTDTQEKTTDSSYTYESYTQGVTTSRLDLSKSGTRRKRKGAIKKDPYFNVNLDKLHEALNADDFFFTSKKDIPGLQPNPVHIDIHYWRQQQMIDQVQNDQAAEQQQRSQSPTHPKKKQKRQSSNKDDFNQQQEDFLIDLNVDVNMGKKQEDTFDLQQKQYLESQHPFLVEQQIVEDNDKGLLEQGFQNAEWRKACYQRQKIHQLVK